MTESDQYRFWAKVTLGVECWIWAGAKSQPGGYGVFQVGGRTVAAHRVMWELMNGPIPDGLFVCHRCDVPACCRIGHLFLGTPEDNNRDREQKGRTARGDRSGRRLHPERFKNISRGNDHWTKKLPGQLADGLLVRKLSEDCVREIRRRYTDGSVTFVSLAREYRVNTGTIQAVVRRKTWKHVT